MEKTDIPALSTIITNSNFNDIYIKLLKNRNKFKAAFASHFNLGKDEVKNKDTGRYLNRESKLPYIDIKKESFDSVYGNSNPYIAIYLKYISTEDENNNKKSKPLLSYLINKRINENSDEEIKFNYNQFRQVTPNEGVKIAESALKYMTWAVEYTPGETSELENNHSDNMVYSANYTSIINWTNNTDIVDDNNRFANYFNGEIKEYLLPDNVAATSPLGQIYNKKLVTSPFSNLQGNPVAYSAMGIDTPKTFNYKMVEQNIARKWLLNICLGDYFAADNFPSYSNNIFSTTLATKAYLDSYVDEIDLYKEAGTNLSIDKTNSKYKTELPSLASDFKKIKPFLPGLRSNSPNMYATDANSLYHPNKIAGVDSLGMLVGSLSMADLDGSFLNVYNSEIDDKLDKYNKSIPEFHVTESNNQLLKPYRFTKPDIERSTIFLSDLSMARPGDLLVNFTKDEAKIGIILSADFTTLTATAKAEDYMKNIIVVSINSGFRMANVGVWLGESGVFGGFATPGDEKSYHLRRLLVKPASETTENSYVNDNFEFFDTELIELDVDIEFENISRKETKLVPNTGELLILQEVVIKGNYGDEPQSLKDEDKNITILPPFDPYNDKKGTVDIVDDKSNIFRNKGKGFKFYTTDGINHILLATFNLKATISTHVEGESPYDIVYNSDIFKNDMGQVKEGFSLTVENDKLTFKNLNESDIVYSNFSIRPLKDEIRPGDDLQLRFALQNNQEINGASKTDDIIGTYDKKMLWRANLYINEGDGDWNISNPWNAPVTKTLADSVKGEYKVENKIITKFISVSGSDDDSEFIWFGNNEWNKNYDGLDRLINNIVEPTEANYLDALTTGDGKQVIKFNNFTYHPKINSTLEHNVVSYSYGCSDSPFEFNDEMRQQQQYLYDYYNKDGQKFLKSRTKWPHSNISSFNLDEYNEYIAVYPTYSNADIALANAFPKRAISLEGWNNTTTPSTIWASSTEGIYIKPSDIFEGMDDKTTPTGSQLSSVTEAALDKFPFLPGWALWHHFAIGGNTPDWINAISAGVDCIGFVSRSASYKNNEYKWMENKNQNIFVKADWYIDINYPTYGIGGHSYRVADYDTKDIQGNIINLGHIKSGDIMYYTDAGDNVHIGMVDYVDRSDENITLSEVHLIESTWYDKVQATGLFEFAKVTNSRTLDKYSSTEWKIVRLKESR